MFRSRAIVLAVSLIVLSACGGSGSDAAKAKATATATASATDPRTSSATSILAKANEQAATGLNLTITASAPGFTVHYSGLDSYGTIDIDPGVVTFRRVDGATYFKADDAFWKSAGDDRAAQIISTINGRWIRTELGSEFDKLLDVADRTFVDKQVLAINASVTKEGTKKVDGIDCVQLNYEGNRSLFVATKNDRLIRMTFGSKSDGRYDFSYRKNDVPEAPAEADAIGESQIN